MCLHRTGFVLSLARTIRHAGVCCRYSGKAKKVDGREESKLVHGRSPSPFDWFHRRGVSLSGSELLLRSIFIQHSRGGWVRNLQHMKRSAGILMYRGHGSELEVLLVHPGGPFWAKKDDGAWSIPKGEYDEAEDPLACAIREFEEELGSRPRGTFIELGEIVQPSRKVVAAFAVEGEFDPAVLRSNRFEIEWPPRSGQMQSFPEVDRVAWFTPDLAKVKILPGQQGFIDRLLAALHKPR
jgi:predicted NUDIX family NTP pyrophosphohydrolase